jgi:hypothetical protein
MRDRYWHFHCSECGMGDLSNGPTVILEPSSIATPLFRRTSFVYHSATAHCSIEGCFIGYRHAYDEAQLPRLQVWPIRVG